jgi:hypothetical protein
MNQRASFLIELLDKLGVPLMSAVQSGTADADGVAISPARDAELLAALLGQSVQLGLSVAGKLDLKEDQGDADAVRLSLSAMAGRLVGDSYRQHGRLPGETETARMSRALEAVLTFADNFTPAAEHSARLRAIGTEKPLFDMAQSQIFYLSAMEPVLAAIAEFPFGQNETGLIQDTAEKLQQRAKSLREAMIGASAEGPESAFAELMILHSLARIYADCHRAETARLIAANNDTPPALDPVWKGFDLRLAMLESLLGSAVPDDETAPVAPAAPVQAPPQAAAPAQPAPAAVAPSAPPAAGPMGFFAHKPDDGAPPSAPPAAPATPAAPASSAPVEQPTSPMGFFKPGVKKADETGGAQ